MKKRKNFLLAVTALAKNHFYYYEDEGNFIFASEMKALWAIGVDKKIDNKMLLNYITLGHLQNCIDKEQTFFEAIYSLPPAHYLTYQPKTNQLSKITRYWSLNKEMKIDIHQDDAIEKFTELFTQSVRRRLRSDVALGTSLSGGLDSSTIAYTINQLQKTGGGTAPMLQTFSAVFPGFENDESKYIRSVSARLNITNHQTEPTAIDLIKDFEKLCYHQEEPFSSSGIFAQYKVFELAKQHHVKVLLDGQGADEILAGYPKYIHWFLQEVLSRHKLGATQIERNAFRKNNQPFRWDIKKIL
jgi:asparagine synthase (glutamine-hydrolysing)